MFFDDLTLNNDVQRTEVLNPSIVEVHPTNNQTLPGKSDSNDSNNPGVNCCSYSEKLFEKTCHCLMVQIQPKLTLLSVASQQLQSWRKDENVCNGFTKSPRMCNRG